MRLARIRRELTHKLRGGPKLMRLVERSLRLDHQTGDEVPQRLLQRQRDRGGEQRRGHEQRARRFPQGAFAPRISHALPAFGNMIRILVTGVCALAAGEAAADPMVALDPNVPTADAVSTSG
ncbi:MAG TPA: hypothetical protein VF403_00620, partial [Kofleriaceae bacterium]